MKLTDFTESAERPLQGTPMHSHDRTMLAGLGFADPDKKNPQHDLACLYLTQKQTGKTVLDWLLATYMPVPVSGKRGGAQGEYHLTKGEGKYATTIGFIDVLFDFEIDLPDVTFGWSMIAEVKIARVGIGDVLRQLRLYAAYTSGLVSDHPLPKALLVAPWDLTAPESEALSSAGFGFLKLGKPFQDWQATIAAAKPAMEL